MNSQEHSLPYFIGIGSQRCGTTWLANCMAEHPQIHMPEKEIRYFDCYFDRGSDWYTEKFSERGPRMVTGEYTPDYLPNHEAMSRLAIQAKNAKLIISLRDPIERLISAFRLYSSRNKTASINIEEALEKDPYLIDHGLYGAHIRHALTLFDRNQIHFILMDDIKQNPQSTLQCLFQWLEVDPQFKPDSTDRKTNVSLSPKLQTALDKLPFLRSLASSRAAEPLRSLVMNLHNKQPTKSQRTENKLVSSQAMAKLRATFREDLLEASELIKRDLSHWLTLKQEE